MRAVERIVEGTILNIKNDEGVWEQGCVNACYGNGKFLIEVGVDEDGGDDYNLYDVEFEIVEGAESGASSSEEEEASSDYLPGQKVTNNEDFVMSDEESESDSRDVEEILKRKGRGETARYLVKWYGEKHPTWEERSELILNFKSDIKQFDKENPPSSKDRKKKRKRKSSRRSKRKRARRESPKKRKSSKKKKRKSKKRKRVEEKPSERKSLRSGRSVKKVNYNEKSLREAYEVEDSSEEESEASS